MWQRKQVTCLDVSGGEGEVSGIVVWDCVDCVGGGWGIFKGAVWEEEAVVGVFVGGMSVEVMLDLERVTVVSCLGQPCFLVSLVGWCRGVVWDDREVLRVGWGGISTGGVRHLVKLWVWGVGYEGLVGEMFFRSGFGRRRSDGDEDEVEMEEWVVFRSGFGRWRSTWEDEEAVGSVGIGVVASFTIGFVLFFWPDAARRVGGCGDSDVSGRSKAGGGEWCRPIGAGGGPRSRSGDDEGGEDPDEE